MAAWEVFHLFQRERVIPYPKAQYPWSAREQPEEVVQYNNCFLSEAGGWESLPFHSKRR